MTAPLLPPLPGYDDPQLIAHGTTALVFRAIQTRLNRPVAIKVIAAEAADGSVPVNVERELAMTVALSSQPHIVSIIDTGFTEDGRRYIVMEYCEGGSYAQILRLDGPLAVADVVEVGITIAAALHAAHGAGIVHRDVKPSNILRSRFGPALTDFGIARAPDELGGTLTREMMTPHHASPEALLHQAQSGLSDIYSLASTMWMLLVGHPPFVNPEQPGMDMYMFRDRVLHEPLPPLEREDVPAWLVAELRRAMAKLPSQRHGSALDFSQALQRGSLGPPAPAVPTIEAPAAPSDEMVDRPGIPDEAWPEPDGDPPVRRRFAPFAPPVTLPVESTTAPDPPASVPPASDPPASPAERRLADTNSVTPGNPHIGGLWPERPDATSAPAAESAAAVAVPPGFEPAPIYRPSRSATSPTAAPRTPGATRPPVVATIGPADRREWVIPAPARPGRAGLIAVLAGATLVAIVSGVLILVSARGDARPEAGGEPSDTLPSLITPGGALGAPTDLSIQDDRGTSVTLTWTDPTGGRQSYVAFLLGPGGAADVVSQKIPPGGEDKSATFSGLDEDADYCFRVGVIRSATDVPVTQPVCTARPRAA